MGYPKGEREFRALVRDSCCACRLWWKTERVDRGKAPYPRADLGDELHLDIEWKKESVSR